MLFFIRPSSEVVKEGRIFFDQKNELEIILPPTRASSEIV